MIAFVLFSGGRDNSYVLGSLFKFRDRLICSKNILLILQCFIMLVGLIIGILIGKFLITFHYIDYFSILLSNNRWIFYSFILLVFSLPNYIDYLIIWKRIFNQEKCGVSPFTSIWRCTKQQEKMQLFADLSIKISFSGMLLKFLDIVKLPKFNPQIIKKLPLKFMISTMIVTGLCIGCGEKEEPPAFTKKIDRSDETFEEKIDRLVRTLSNNDSRMKRAAAKKIISLGHSAFPYLIDNVSDKIVGETITMIISKMGNPAIHSLIKRLDNPEKKKRIEAINLLTEEFTQKALSLLKNELKLNAQSLSAKRKENINYTIKKINRKIQRDNYEKLWNSKIKYISNLEFMLSYNKDLSFIISAFNGEYKKIKTYLDKGNFVGVRDEGGITALYSAASQDHIKIVKLLLDHGADPNHFSEKGLSPLIVASQQGFVDIINLLIKNGADVDATHPVLKNMTALHIAAAAGQIDSMAVLLDANTNIDRKGELYRTPLISAILMKKENSALFLIEKGANVNAKDKFEHTSYDFAKLLGNKKIIVAIKNHGGISGYGKYHDEILTAAFNGNVQYIADLLKKGANPNESNISGHTVFMNAADAKQFGVMDLLLSKGARIDAQNSKGITALCASVVHGHTEVQRYLLEKGSNPYKENILGFHAVHSAFSEVKAQSIIMFHKLGVDLNKPSSKNITSLGIVSTTGFTYGVEILLRFGANVDQKGLDGWTPLMSAASAGHYNIVEMLLGAGANKDLKNDAGKTALEVTNKSKHPLIYQLIKGDEAVPQLIENLGVAPRFSIYNRPRPWTLSKAAIAAEKVLLSMGQVAFPALADTFLTTESDRTRNRIISIFGKTEIEPIDPDAKALYFFRKGTERESYTSPFSDSPNLHYPELTEIGQPAIPYLVKLARNMEIGSFNVYAMKALGELGSAAGEAYDDLLGLLDVFTDEYDDRMTVYDTLTRIRPEQRTKIIIKCASDSHKHNRVRAIFALGSILPTTDEILDTLIKKLHHDSESEVRFYAAVSMSKIAPTSKKAKAALEKTVNEDLNEKVREVAREVLNKSKAKTNG